MAQRSLSLVYLFGCQLSFPELISKHRFKTPISNIQPAAYVQLLIFSEAGVFMKTIGMLTMTLGVLGTAALILHGQPPAAPLRTGPGVQAAQDSREPDIWKTCKVPPPAPAGRGGAAQGKQANPAPAGPRDYTVAEIPGVIAAGQKWKDVWQVDGNNADGIVGTKDGGLLIAQNDKSDVVKLDKAGNPSVVYSDTNTGGALSMSPKGVLLLNSRGVNPAILELAPKRTTFASKYQGDPLDCIGTVLNDLSADSKGGAYFTMGGLFYANPKGEITKYGDNLRTNGIILSADEKSLYVTNGAALAAFDVQKDGSLTNQREFAKLEGGGNGDGSAIDSTGRIYVTTNPGVQVIGADGKYLGIIPTPRGVISVAFSGPNKKTLYAVVSTREGDPPKQAAQIISIQTIAEGYKGRAK
jgi:gluconolactonase